MSENNSDSDFVEEVVDLKPVKVKGKADFSDMMN